MHSPLPTAVAVLLAFAATASGQAVVQRTVGAMGTWLELAVMAPDRARALAASEAAVRAVAVVEGRLSTWRPESEIARANASPVGVAFGLCPPTAADVRFALAFARDSEGTFVPGLGALLDAYGMRGERRWPEPAALAAARVASASGAIDLRGDALVRTAPTAWLATDALAKGIALREAAVAVRAAGAAATFDFGGQWLVEGGTAMRVDLAHPDDRDRVVATLQLQPGFSASSSGNGERRVNVDGRAHGHLLDPRTGGFAVDFGSVTAVAADPARADAASTALFVAGPVAGIALARRLGVDAVFVVRRDGAAVQLVATEGMQALLNPRHP